MQDTTVVELIDIKKTYRQGSAEINAVRGVSLSVKRGSFNAIIGPSGAGKSSLLHMMGGLDTPSGGSVLVGGIDIYKEMNDFGRSRLRNSKMGFVFQFYNLLADFTVLENVVMPALMSKEHKSSKKQLLEKAGALLGRLGLSGRASHRPGQLSGGEAQRTAIARALMNDPEIMLCDEPTGNLDSSLGRQIYGILYELVKERQMSAVIITHYDHNWVKFDNIHVMRDGELAS